MLASLSPLTTIVPHPADKPLSLPHLVEAFFADSHLEYTCEKCGHGQANAKHKVKQLPRYMVVHLKRFQPNWEKGTYEKSFTVIFLLPPKPLLSANVIRLPPLPPWLFSCDPAPSPPVLAFLM
jgi:ubiquitin C-terminal hydrolase